MLSPNFGQRKESCIRQVHLANAYLTMRERVIRAGFAWEIDWQDSRSLSRLTESEFLAESAWVILSSGMRESVVRRCYEGVSQAFVDWFSASVIAARRVQCEEEALQVFNHLGKVRAIGTLCERVAKCGFRSILKSIQVENISFLQTFDFIGPITSFHLAKNLGLDVVKPDRHLVRMASVARCSCPEELCRTIAEITGDKLSVVDLVLWRYATLDPSWDALLTFDLDRQI